MEADTPEDTISIHALHEESDADAAKPKKKTSEFQSTLSMRRATQVVCVVYAGYQFQSTLSMRRATLASLRNAGIIAFQSTLSMRRATEMVSAIRQSHAISIHALHEESDPR